jgi:hypothetical protein
MSTSLTITKMKIKTTLRCYLTPVRMVSSRTQTATIVGKDAGKRNPYVLFLGM